MRISDWSSDVCSSDLADVPLFHSLATLAFDRRRSSYFRNELFSALTMLDRGYIDFPTLKGSWAGAMGQPQFMPWSYRAYAEDFDGDGKREIGHNRGDALAAKNGRATGRERGCQ